MCYKDLKVSFSKKIGFLNKKGIIRNSSKLIDCNNEFNETFDTNNQSFKLIRLNNNKGIFLAKQSGDKLNLDFNLTNPFLETFIDYNYYTIFGNKYSRIIKDVSLILLFFSFIIALCLRYKYKLLEFIKNLKNLKEKKKANNHLVEEVQELKDQLENFQQKISFQLNIISEAQNKEKTNDFIFPSAPEIDNNKTNFCSDCNRYFKNKTGLNNHMNSRTCKKNCI